MEAFGDSGLTGLEGDRRSGQDVRTQNVMACMAIANIVKTSLGPVGLDKMLVDDIGDTTVTNDGEFDYLHSQRTRTNTSLPTISLSHASHALTPLLASQGLPY